MLHFDLIGLLESPQLTAVLGLGGGRGFAMKAAPIIVRLARHIGQSV